MYLRRRNETNDSSSVGGVGPGSGADRVFGRGHRVVWQRLAKWW